MKAQIEWGWQTASMHVFLFDRHPDRYFTIGEDGRLVPHEVDFNSDNAKPALVLSAEALDELLRAAAEKRPPQDATVDALNDARKVRDRLLTLIERKAGEAAS